MIIIFQFVDMVTVGYFKHMFLYVLLLVYVHKTVPKCK